MSKDKKVVSSIELKTQWFSPEGYIKKDLEDNVERSDVPKEVIQRQLTQFRNGYQNITSQFDETVKISV